LFYLFYGQMTEAGQFISVLISQDKKCGVNTHGHMTRVGQNHTYIRCIYSVGQNRIYAPYMTVYLVISLPKIPYIHRIYIWIWPTLCIYTVYGRIFGGFPDKNTVCTPYMYACGANPTHTVCTYSRGQRILFQKQQLLLYSIA
jgi:hypothetical protein